MICPSCGKENNDDARYCARCHKLFVDLAGDGPITSPQSPAKIAPNVGLGCLAGVIICGLFIFFFVTRDKPETGAPRADTPYSRCAEALSLLNAAEDMRFDEKYAFTENPDELAKYLFEECRDAKAPACVGKVRSGMSSVCADFWIELDGVSKVRIAGKTRDKNGCAVCALPPEGFYPGSGRTCALKYSDRCLWNEKRP